MINVSGTILDLRRRIEWLLSVDALDGRPEPARRSGCACTDGGVRAHQQRLEGVRGSVEVGGGDGGALSGLVSRHLVCCSLRPRVRDLRLEDVHPAPEQRLLPDISTRDARRTVRAASMFTSVLTGAVHTLAVSLVCGCS